MKGGGCEKATHIFRLLSSSIFPVNRLTYVDKLAVLMLYPFICLTFSQVGLIYCWLYGEFDLIQL